MHSPVILAAEANGWVYRTNANELGTNQLDSDKGVLDTRDTSLPSTIHDAKFFSKSEYLASCGGGGVEQPFFNERGVKISDHCHSYVLQISSDENQRYLQSFFRQLQKFRIGFIATATRNRKP